MEECLCTELTLLYCVKGEKKTSKPTEPAPGAVSVLEWIWLRLSWEWMATACSLRFSHMALCQNSNLSSRPSIESRGVQRKPSPGPSAAGGGSAGPCSLEWNWWLLSSSMGMSHMRQPAALLLLACLPACRGGEVKSPAFTCSQQLFGVFRNQIIRCNFHRSVRQNCWNALLNRDQHIQNPLVSAPAQTCAAFLCICGCLGVC